jgi:hypothetical protein
VIPTGVVRKAPVGVIDGCRTEGSCPKLIRHRALDHRPNWSHFVAVGRAESRRLRDTRLVHTALSGLQEMPDFIEFLYLARQSLPLRQIQLKSLIFAIHCNLSLDSYPGGGLAGRPVSGTKGPAKPHQRAALGLGVACSGGGGYPAWGPLGFESPPCPKPKPARTNPSSTT